jgi:hypothetical protein
MRAVGDHGRPLVDDPTRLEGVAALGLVETSFLKATRVAPTRYLTGLVDLERGRLLNVVADHIRTAVDGWLSIRPRDWLAHIATVALGPMARLRQRARHRLGMPGWWWTISTPSGWPTTRWARSAAACSRPPSATGAANQVPRTGSASCC